MYAEESVAQTAYAEQVVVEAIVPLPPGVDVMQTDVILLVLEIDLIKPAVGTQPEPEPEPEPSGELLTYGAETVSYGGEEVGY